MPALRVGAGPETLSLPHGACVGRRCGRCTSHGVAAEGEGGERGWMIELLQFYFPAVYDTSMSSCPLAQNNTHISSSPSTHIPLRRITRKLGVKHNSLHIPGLSESEGRS